MEQRLPREERGFTLIELLITIALVGILAGIAIPVYLATTRSGEDADAKSNARNLVSYMESCYTAKEDFTLCSTQADVEAGDIDWGPAPGQVRVTTTGKSSYEIVAVSKARSGGSNHTFTASRGANGLVVRTCSAGGSLDGGGCRDGKW